MTVQELLSVASTEAVQIIIREGGDGKWIYAWKIGENVQVGRYDFIHNSRGELKEAGRFFVPDNRVEVCRVDGRCRMMIIPKSLKYLPKEVQSLEVSSFRSSYVDRTENRGLEIWCYPKDFIPPQEEHRVLKNEESKTNEQLSLFDSEGVSK